MVKNGSTTLTWRVTQLEKSYYEIDAKLEKIMTNELPHLHEEIASLKTRVNILIVAVVVEIGVILLGKFL